MKCTTTGCPRSDILNIGVIDAAAWVCRSCGTHYDRFARPTVPMVFSLWKSQEREIAKLNKQLTEYRSDYADLLERWRKLERKQRHDDLDGHERDPRPGSKTAPVD